MLQLGRLLLVAAAFTEMPVASSQNPWYGLAVARLVTMSLAQATHIRPHGWQRLSS